MYLFELTADLASTNLTLRDAKVGPIRHELPDEIGAGLAAAIAYLGEHYGTGWSEGDAVSLVEPAEMSVYSAHLAESVGFEGRWTATCTHMPEEPAKPKKGA